MININDSYYPLAFSLNVTTLPPQEVSHPYPHPHHKTNIDIALT